MASGRRRKKLGRSLARESAAIGPGRASSSPGRAAITLALGFLALAGCGRSSKEATAAGTGGSDGGSGYAVGGAANGGTNSGSGGTTMAGSAGSAANAAGGGVSGNANSGSGAGGTGRGGASGRGGRPSGADGGMSGEGGEPIGGSSGDGVGGTPASGGAGGHEEWADGEFRVCVTETAYTRARVYRYDPSSSHCMSLWFEAPSDACPQGYPVSGPWCLASGSLAVGVDDCAATGATLASSITGSFTVSDTYALEADLALHFDGTGVVPAELTVAVSSCRLSGCSDDDCRR